MNSVVIKFISDIRREQLKGRVEYFTFCHTWRDTGELFELLSSKIRLGIWPEKTTERAKAA